jgi:hypothetical protein
MQAATRKVSIGGREFTARQFTLGEMIAALDTPPEYIEGMEVLDVLLLEGEGMTLSDLLRFSDATADDLKAMTEADIAALATACKEANPRFFTMRAKLAKLGEGLIQQQAA